MRNVSIITLGILLSSLSLIQVAQAQEVISGAEMVAPQSVFESPRFRGRYVELQQSFSKALAEQDSAAAQAELLKLLAIAPLDPIALYNQACRYASGGKTEEAIVCLTHAIECGLYSADLIAKDKDLESIQDDPRFAAALQTANRKQASRELPFAELLTPATPVEGVVWVGEQNVGFDFRAGLFLGFFDLSSAQAKSPVLPDDESEEGKLLRRWFKWRKAAGNVGDLYDNRDADHSNMSFGKFPQLTRLEYPEQAKSLRLNNGLQKDFLYNVVTIGNSSTAYTQGPLWRSHPRRAYTDPGLTNLLYTQYFRNQLYFYPEHRDHDPEHGDVFPANTPYVVISQGSSGSDKPFMEAFVQALAAFKPDVKEKLKQNGALMPTLQMLFRYSNRNVRSHDTYLSGVAHPPVFDEANLDPLQFIKMAQELDSDSLPPLVQMQVVEEEEARPGIDFFDAPHERMFDTPSAIARVHRTSRYMRKMVVSVEGSRDLNGQPLQFHWKLLCGNPGLVRITPLDEKGTRAEIEVAYHSERVSHPGSGLPSARVDIGVFADNGSLLSAPGIISTYFPANVYREYQQGEIAVIDYTDPAHQKLYGDPMLSPERDWRDEYHYDPVSKALSGWTRTRKDGEAEEFTPEGLLITEAKPDGQPLRVKAVAYQVIRPENGVPTLKVHYSEEDRLYSDIVPK